MYDIEFDIRIGLHNGDAVIGSLGSIGQERLTAIGEVPNVASRIEAANTEAGTRLLISEALHEKVKDSVQVADFVRVRLRGTSDRITLYEIDGLKPEAQAALNAGKFHETILFAGKKWIRLFAEDELALNERRVVALEDYDVVIGRRTEGYYAFNNACPHLHLPFFDHSPPADGEVGSSMDTDSMDTDMIPPNSTIIVKSCVWVCHAAARSWRSPFTNLTPRMISAN